jgi:hypothetical protein
MDQGMHDSIVICMSNYAFNESSDNDMDPDTMSLSVAKFSIGALTSRTPFMCCHMNIASLNPWVPFET